MVLVTIEEAQKDLAKLLTEVASGQEVVIHQDNVPLGRLMPMTGQTANKPRRQWGRFAGGAQMSDDFDAPLSVHEV